MLMQGFLSQPDLRNYEFLVVGECSGMRMVEGVESVETHGMSSPGIMKLLLVKTILAG